MVYNVYIYTVYMSGNILYTLYTISGLNLTIDVHSVAGRGTLQISANLKLDYPHDIQMESASLSH